MLRVQVTIFASYSGPCQNLHLRKLPFKQGFFKFNVQNILYPMRQKQPSAVHNFSNTAPSRSKTKQHVRNSAQKRHFTKINSKILVTLEILSIELYTCKNVSFFFFHQ